MRLLDAPLLFSNIKIRRLGEGKAKAIHLLSNIVDSIRQWLFSIILLLYNKINTTKVLIQTYVVVVHINKL